MIFPNFLLDGGLNFERRGISRPFTYDKSKSPGSDGFTAEFYKFFWKDIGFFTFDLLISFDNNELSATRKRVLIFVSFKGKRIRDSLKFGALSPSASIAKQLKKVIPFLINEDQTGFISGRFIGEKTRSLYDLFHYTEK
jgi:hypothetical protein